MSERKSKPSSSRRYVQASTSRAGSTTSVVSPCASLRSTSPGTPSKVISRPWPAIAPAWRSRAPRRPDAAGGTMPRRRRLSVLGVLSCAPRACLAPPAAPQERELSTRYSADLVRRRDAGLDLLLEPDDALEEGLRPGRAAGDV